MNWGNLFGTYGWWVAGLALLAGEIVVPGIFLMWLGLAALVVGVVLWVMPDLTWYWQVAVFGGAALALVFGLRPLVMRNLKRESERPALNRRLHAMIGRTGVISDAIEEGYGRARIGETIWRVRGPDLAAGTPVRVTGVDEKTLSLLVEAVESRG